MNANAIAFVHIVECGVDDDLPPSGTPLFLKYDFAAGARLSGRLIPTMGNYTDRDTVFGGVATDLQPSQAVCRAVKHTNAERKFMEVAVVIHGRVDCFLRKREIPPGTEHHVILARWYPPASDTRNEAPNATLFVT